MDTDRIVAGILKRDTRSISRAITIIEEGNENGYDIIKSIYPKTGHAQIIGITGPPGVGKSTMIGMLSRMLSQMGKKVAIVAVDASSPFSGGAILGNRIRMQNALSEYGIYMRSVSSRGSNGGLSLATWNIAKILDAAGNDYVIIETVGAGQSDIDIVYLADTVIVDLAPGLGDSIQAIKSGTMEIGDIFVINKIDRDGSYLAIKDIMDNVYSRDGWIPPVIGTNSLTGEGYEKLIEAINEHRKYGETKGRKRFIRYREEVKMALLHDMENRVDAMIASFADGEEKHQIYSETVDPQTFARNLLSLAYRESMQER
ncbi:MAG: methylmalonyl Co-A mutase-associated GTPase MeaB [Thermoplasmata archaeon]